MNKILKISLLFSIVAISLFNAPTQCMEVEPEKDNLQLALKRINELPRNFNEISNQDHVFLINSNEAQKKEMGCYTTTIRDELIAESGNRIL